jgi:hypothetical protein
MTFMLAFTAGYWTCMLVGFVAWVIWKLKHPKHHLFSELKEGMDALVAMRREPPCPGAKILTEGNRDFLEPYCRKHRDAPERNLSREIQAGMAELNERDGIDYKFLGMGDREDVR